jgi:hypothetical protein
MKNIFESTKKDCEIKDYKIIINEKEGYFSIVKENKRKKKLRKKKGNYEKQGL